MPWSSWIGERRTPTPRSGPRIGRGRAALPMPGADAYVEEHLAQRTVAELSFAMVSVRSPPPPLLSPGPQPVAVIETSAAMPRSSLVDSGLILRNMRTFLL